MSIRKAYPDESDPTLPSHRPVRSAAEASTQIWVRDEGQTQNGRPRWLVLVAGGLIVMFVAVFLALVAGGILLWRSDWILPGVEVLSVDVGNRPAPEAEKALAAYWSLQQITLTSSQQTLTVSPEEIGILLDVKSTINAAQQQGRSWDTLQRYIQGEGQLSLQPDWVFDATTARNSFRELAWRLDILPENAGIQIIDGQVVTTPPIAGSRLDAEATLSNLAADPAAVYLARQLPLVEIPVQPEIGDVSTVAEQAGQLLSTSVNLHGFDPISGQVVDWVVSPESWTKWLTLEIESATNGQFSWRLDSRGARDFLLGQVQSLGSDRYLDWDAATSALSEAIANRTPQVNVRIYHYPSEHAVQFGETIASIGRTYGVPYPWIQAANPFAGDNLSVGQRLTIPSPDELLPLPVVENKRIVVSISQQRMWAYENGSLKWDWIASTGIDDSPTSPGIFQIQSHEVNAYAGSWDLWMPYFMGIYRPVPSSQFMNGFHGFPTRDGSNLLWTGNLGSQVTYGCILISTTNASLLFDWAEEGIVVEVQR